MSHGWSRNVGRALHLVFFLALFVALAATNAPNAQAGSAASCMPLNCGTSRPSAAPPVNVAATYLFIECPDLVAVTKEVRFAYVQLDGNAAVRSATAANRGLIVANNVPVVALSRLSFDFSENALYRFILDDGKYVDIVVEPKYWSVDRRNSVLYTGLSC